jgi:hypothetical protein
MFVAYSLKTVIGYSSTFILLNVSLNHPDPSFGVFDVEMLNPVSSSYS